MSITTIQFGISTGGGSGGIYGGGLSTSEAESIGYNGELDASLSPIQGSQEGVLSDSAIQSGNFNANTHLTKNFTIGDLSDYAKAYPYKHTNRGLNGLSVNQVVQNLRNVALYVLEPIVAKWGKGSFRINSGYRSNSTSQHGSGQAVDLVFNDCEGNTNAKHGVRCVEIAKILPNGWSQIILEKPGAARGIVHIGWGNFKGKLTNQSRQMMTSPNNAHSKITRGRGAGSGRTTVDGIWIVQSDGIIINDPKYCIYGNRIA